MLVRHSSTAGRSLSIVAIVLFGMFASGLAGMLFPLRLLNPAWQLRLAGALVSSGLVPLGGLALLRVALALDPRDPIVKQRWRFCSGLALAAALGFALLLPVQILAGIRQGQAIERVQAGRIRSAEARLVQLRQAVSEASSPEDLNARLRDLKGPALSQEGLNQPLPLLKARVGAVLDEGRQEISRERQRIVRRGPLELFAGAMRITVVCFGMATGFAALAERPGSERSLLVELLDGFENLGLHLRFLRLVRRERVSEKEYIRQLSDDARTARQEIGAARQRVAPKLLERLFNRVRIAMIDPTRAIGFSGRADSPDAKRTVWMELQGKLEYLRRRNRFLRIARRRRMTEKDYIRKLSGEASEKD